MSLKKLSYEEDVLRLKNVSTWTSLDKEYQGFHGDFIQGNVIKFTVKIQWLVAVLKAASQILMPGIGSWCQATE